MSVAAPSLAVALALAGAPFQGAAGAPPSQAADPAPAAGLLCFDEAHHNVHLATRSYAAFVELARGLGYSVRILTRAWSAETLAGCDLVVTAGPRSAGRERPLAERGGPAFTGEEADAAAGWVEAGGGLLLVTDHPPIGTAARPLADRLGVAMSQAFTEDSEHFDPDLRCLVFSRHNGLLASHPITEGRSAAEQVERVGTYLGQSLARPPGSVSLLTLGPGAVDRTRGTDGVTWADPSPGDPLAPAAGRSQALAMTLGAGRVVVTGEAAMLTAHGPASGFEVAGLDNRRFAANILFWLAGRL
jgi:hypothetical protein